MIPHYTIFSLQRFAFMFFFFNYRFAFMLPYKYPTSEGYMQGIPNTRYLSHIYTKQNLSQLNAFRWDLAMATACLQMPCSRTVSSINVCRSVRIQSHVHDHLHLTWERHIPWDSLIWWTIISKLLGRKSWRLSILWPMQWGCQNPQYNQHLSKTL